MNATIEALRKLRTAIELVRNDMLTLEGTVDAKGISHYWSMRLDRILADHAERM